MDFLSLFVLTIFVSGLLTVVFVREYYRPESNLTNKKKPRPLKVCTIEDINELFPEGDSQTRLRRIAIALVTRTNLTRKQTIQGIRVK